MPQRVMLPVSWFGTVPRPTGPVSMTQAAVRKGVVQWLSTVKQRLEKPCKLKEQYGSQNIANQK